MSKYNIKTEMSRMTRADKVCLEERIKELTYVVELYPNPANIVELRRLRRMR